MEPQLPIEDVNNTVFTLNITEKKPSRFNYGVKEWKVPLPSYSIEIQKNEIQQGFDNNIKDLKKRVACENAWAPMEEHQRWLLKITGTIQYKGKVQKHDLFQVLKDTWRLDEYPLLMCIAKHSVTKEAHICMEEFNLDNKKQNTVESLQNKIDAAKNAFPGGSYAYVLIDHSADNTHRTLLSLKREMAAEMKEFRNKEVQYTKLDRLALDTWVERCNQGKVFWDDNQNTNEHAVEDAKQPARKSARKKANDAKQPARKSARKKANLERVDEVDADTKPPAKNRSKKTFVIYD
jgi:hypothetical protein